MDQQYPPPSPPKSAIPRRGPPLPAIRTDVAQQQRPRPVLQKPRPQRLRPPEILSSQSQSIPLQPEPAKRQSSKNSLRSLFARNKALREDRKQEVTLPAVGERRGSATPSTTVPDTPRSIAPTLASASTLHVPSQVPTPTESTFSSGKSSKAPKAKPEPKSKISASWSPPPLFQAYPQSLKHARLSAPNVPADSIIRIHAAQSDDFQNPFQPGETETASAEAVRKGKKDAKDKKAVKRGGPSPLDQIVFLKKIFVLVTAGYLLQYSGEGNYNRLPEKMMRLGPTSAAFASDAIPGKPYVVQVSQKSADDGTLPTTAGRTFLSRIGIQSVEARRSVRTFLVIMANAQEMNAWLIALRKTIESLGGKKYVPEATLNEDGEAIEIPSNTLLATRGSRIFASRKPSLKESNPPSPSSDSISRRSPAPSIHRKSSYYDEQPPVLPNPVKTSNRLSITGPLDAPTVPSIGQMFGNSEIIYENPRVPPVPTQRSRLASISPPSTLPAADLPAQSPAVVPRQLRKPSSTSTVNVNRRSLTSYTAVQSNRQEEIIRASRPLSFVRNTSPSVNPSDNPSALSSTGQQSLPSSRSNISLPGPNKRLSTLRSDSSQSVAPADVTSQKPAVTETGSTTPSKPQGQVSSSKVGIKRDSILPTTKRQSLVMPGQVATHQSSSTPSVVRSSPIIPPRKYSLTRTESAESTSFSSLTPKYYERINSPDTNQTSRLPQQRPSQLNQSRLSSVTEKGRPLNRLPNIEPDSSETPTSPAPPSNLARYALGNDRTIRTPTTVAKARETEDRSVLSQNRKLRQVTTPASMNEQQPPRSKISTPTSSPLTSQTSQEISSRRSSLLYSQPQSQQVSRSKTSTPVSSPPIPQIPQTPHEISSRRSSLYSQPQLQQASRSKTSTPTSSPQIPQIPQTPQEVSSRRSSFINSQPQSQQTSPRTRRNPNLSLLPPAPPPNFPLPDVPPSIAFRHIPLWQKKSHQSQSQPQPQPQQTHLPRPSISSSTLSSSSTIPSAANQHLRRRSSELRDLQHQMELILNRKQSDASIPASPPKRLTPTSEYPSRNQDGQ